MEVTLKETGPGELPQVKRLFRTAFPPEERPPFFFLKNRMKTGRGKCLTIWDGDQFGGFFYLICHRDMAYMFFFAVDDGRRGRGLGSAALAALKERYAGKRLFLARERLDEPCDNMDQRVRRHGFYLRNGFVDLPLHIQEGGVVYDVMSVGGSIAPQEYSELIYGWTGRVFQWFSKMEMRET